MASIFVVPAPGTTIRDPATGLILPAVGATVVESGFWDTRLLQGDVTLGTPPTVSGTGTGSTGTTGTGTTGTGTTGTGSTGTGGTGSGGSSSGSGSTGTSSGTGLTLGTTAGTAAAGNDPRITGAVQQSELGQALGVATLDASKRLPAAQLPAGVAPRPPPPPRGAAPPPPAGGPPLPASAAFVQTDALGLASAGQAVTPVAATTNPTDSTTFATADGTLFFTGAQLAAYLATKISSSSAGSPSSTGITAAGSGTAAALTNAVFAAGGQFGQQRLVGGAAALPTSLLPSSGVYALEAWGAFSTLAGSGKEWTLFAGSGFSVYVDGVTGHAVYYNGASYVTSGASVCDGAQHHFRIVVRSASVDSYVDGALVGSDTQTLGAQGGTLYLGASPGNQSGLSGANGVSEFAVLAGDPGTGSYTPPTAAYTSASAGLVVAVPLNGSGALVAGPGASSAGASSGSSGGATPAPTVIANAITSDASGPIPATLALGGGSFVACSPVIDVAWHGGAAPASLPTLAFGRSAATPPVSGTDYGKNNHDSAVVQVSGTGPGYTPNGVTYIWGPLSAATNFYLWLLPNDGSTICYVYPTAIVVSP